MKIMDNSFVCRMIYVIIISHWFPNNCGSEKTEVRSQHYTIGVLLPIHQNHEDIECYKDMFDLHEITHSVHVLEALYFAMDMIKNDKTLLPNVTLDLAIEDFCSSVEIGRMQIMKWLKDSFRSIGKTENWLSCPSNNTKSILIGSIISRNMYRFSEIEHILHGFRIPLISYTEPQQGVLDDIEAKSVRYYTKVDPIYSLSTGNLFMTDVIFEILAHFNWTYVAVVHSSSSFNNIDVIKRFKNLATSYKVCIADIIDAYQIISLVGLHLRDIMSSYDAVDVIICYCNEIELALLYHAMEGYGNTKYKNGKKFVVIAGNAEGEQLWTRTYFHSNQRLDGLLFVSMRPQYIEEFDDYYLSRTVQNNPRNPWFKEYWELYFRCKFQPSNEDEKECKGNEKLTYGYKQYAGVRNIIKSVHVLAHALHDVLTQNSTNLSFVYSNDVLRTSVSNVNFTLFEEEISFDKALPTMVKYDIHTSQFIDKSFVPIKVGEYVKSGHTYYEELTTKHDFKANEKIFSKPGTLRIQGRLRMHDNISFPINVKSSCSELCPPGYATIKRNDTCCWDCKPCNSLEILLNGTLCTECDYGYMANSYKNECLPIPFRKSAWYDMSRLVSTSFSLLSVTLTLFTSVVFIKYRNTPVVKSSTRELCYVMFTGMVLANFTPFILIITLSEITCTMIRIIPPITFTMIYAALLVKTNRIARLLAMSKKKFPNMNPKYMSLRAQISITFMVISVGVLICLISLYCHPPRIDVDYKEKDNGWIGSKACHLDKDILLETFAFVVLLVVLCTHYAIETRNLPENFNEAKCIGFAMYATLLTGTAFALVYFNSDKKILSINMSVSINSLVLLMFLFAPKLYIILWKPERNTRAHFTTDNNVRSYLGNVKRSHSRCEVSQQYSSLKEAESNATLKASNEQMMNAIIESLNLLDADERTFEKPINEDESKCIEILDNLKKNHAEVYRKLKLCHNELNRLQNEAQQ